MTNMGMANMGSRDCNDDHRVPKPCSIKCERQERVRDSKQGLELVNVEVMWREVSQ
jgi:hypothetical protein